MKGFWRFVLEAWEGSEELKSCEVKDCVWKQQEKVGGWRTVGEVAVNDSNSFLSPCACEENGIFRVYISYTYGAAEYK